MSTPLGTPHMARSCLQRTMLVLVAYAVALPLPLTLAPRSSRGHPTPRIQVHHRRPFLSPENFKTPYQGFQQVVWIRAISGGLFYPLEDMFIQRLDPSWRFSPLIAGSLAGIISSAILNPLQAIKYRTWARARPQPAWSEAARMYHNGGLTPFRNGLLPRIGRDTLFGATYTSLRFRWANEVPEGWELASNTAAAAVATLVSGPLNYAQNVQYGTSSHETQVTIRGAFRLLVSEAAAMPTTRQRIGLVGDRLRIGWGTIRVAVGMAFGNYLYDKCAASSRQSGPSSDSVT
jgi:hypothetical protein